MKDETIGSIFTALGIILVICNLTIFNSEQLGLASALAAAVVIVIGLYFTTWKNKGSDDDMDSNGKM